MKLQNTSETCIRPICFVYYIDMNHEKGLLEFIRWVRMTKNRLKSIIEDKIAEYGGEPVKKTVLFYLEHKYSVKPEEILNKPEQFVTALKDIYGPFEKIIEREICNNIAEKYGINYKNQGLIEIAKVLKNI